LIESIWLQWLCENSHWFQLEKRELPSYVASISLSSPNVNNLDLDCSKQETIDKWGMSCFCFYLLQSSAKYHLLWKFVKLFVLIQVVHLWYLQQWGKKNEFIFCQFQIEGTTIPYPNPIFWRMLFSWFSSILNLSWKLKFGSLK
jgi:hypothetical protein